MTIRVGKAVASLPRRSEGSTPKREKRVFSGEVGLLSRMRQTMPTTLTEARLGINIAQRTNWVAGFFPLRSIQEAVKKARIVCPGTTVTT